MRSNAVGETPNERAVRLMIESAPVLVDVRPAIECIPGMERNTVLTSGAPLPWEVYKGGQRAAIIAGVLSEGLAQDADEAVRMLNDGLIDLGACHDHSCVGSITGIYTASTPVFVVQDRGTGRQAFCSLYEGASRKRLTYGVYDEDVQANLTYLSTQVAPEFSSVLARSGGIDVSAIIRKALQMGDELHSRNSAATALLTRDLLVPIIETMSSNGKAISVLGDYLRRNELLFLHIAMAAAKLATDAAHGVEGSSIVTAMTTSFSEFSIRVSGLGDDWFRAPVPKIEGRLFEGFTQEDVGHMGGESLIVETIGLGGFAAAAAFGLQRYAGGSAAAMIGQTESMYEITIAEHPHYLIPYFDFRGVPLGIDILAVEQKRITPAIDGGIAHKDGGHIGAGIMLAPLQCFEKAAAAFSSRYGSPVVAASESG